MWRRRLDVNRGKLRSDEHGRDDKPTLTLYNAQHEDLMEEMVGGFTEETGIEVELRNGNDLELANQIVAGGRRRRPPTCSSPRTPPR